MSRIRNEIFARNIPYKDMADALGISISALGKKINGKSEFKLNEGVKLQQQFFPDVDLLELFEQDDYKKTG